MSSSDKASLWGILASNEKAAQLSSEGGSKDTV